jgi:energy-coupling factor transport system permease protein
LEKEPETFWRETGMDERMGNLRRMNSFAKLIMLVLFSVMVFLIADPVFMIVVIAAVLSVKQVYAKRSMVARGILFFAGAIFLAQLIFNHSGRELYELSFLRLTTGGVSSGIMFAGRFLSLLAMSWVFVMTTSASSLSSALTSSGVPYRYAYLPGLAMRFVPTFQFELASVRDAQVTRGLRLEKGLRGLFRSIKYTLTPMLVLAISKVNSLASSMTGRGFGAYPKRTMLEPNAMTAWDAASVLAAVALIVMVIISDRSLGLGSGLF